MSTLSVTQSRMTYQEARTTTAAWLAVRSTARAALLAKARSLHPARRMGYETDYQHEIRKLWKWPSDLNEARLLRLIDHPRGWRDVPPGDVEGRAS